MAWQRDANGLRPVRQVRDEHPLFTGGRREQHGPDGEIGVPRVQLLDGPPLGNRAARQPQDLGMAPVERFVAACQSVRCRRLSRPAVHE